jgi:YD repeat-containing protein
MTTSPAFDPSAPAQDPACAHAHAPPPGGDRTVSIDGPTAVYDRSKAHSEDPTVVIAVATVVLGDSRVPRDSAYDADASVTAEPPTVSLDGPTSVFVRSSAISDLPHPRSSSPVRVSRRAPMRLPIRLDRQATREPSQQVPRPPHEVPRPMPAPPRPRLALGCGEDPLGMPPPLKRAQFAKPLPDSFEARSERVAAFRLGRARRALQPTAAPVIAAAQPRWLRDPQSRPDYPQLLRELCLEPNDLRRNQVPHPETTRAAGWVDVATGNVIASCRDFALGGASPVVMERVWLSCSRYRGPLGIGWHHAFDLGLIRGPGCVAVRLADGRVVWFPEPQLRRDCYDADERLGLSHDEYGYVLRAADGCKRRFVPHRAQAAYVLSSVSTRDGRELRFGYDHRARLVRITAAPECSLELEYDTHDRLLRIDAPDVLHANKRLVLVAYGYDGDGHLRKAANALGQPQRYIHERGLLIARVNRNGGSTHFNWDAGERCVHCWIDGGVRDRKLTYLDGVTLVLDSLGHETAYHHDGAVVQRIVNATGHTRQFTRGPGRRLECEVDELGRCVHRSYDARGNLRELSLPDGATWRFGYDDRDRLLRAEDALGGVWRFEYDPAGRPLSSVDPLGCARRYAYRGRWLVAVYEPDGRQTRLSYDAAGNLAVRIAPDGCVTRYVHDAWGQLVAIIDGDDQRHERQFDPLGRLVRMRGADGTRCELGYDAEGNLISWRDGERTVRFTYQGSGRISSQKDGGATLCLEYDSEEQLVAIVNEHGRVYRLMRDPSGAICEISGVDGCTRSYTRDAAGRITRAEWGGAFSEYEYDSADRLLEVLHSDGGFEGYRYRADGALESAWNQHVTLEFECDALGRVIVERQGPHAVESQYDAAGRRTGVQSSLGMRQLLEYSGLGMLRRMSERASGFELRFERDALGLELERVMPAGARSVWVRDAFGQPSSHRLESGSGELARLTEYAWQPGGRLSRVLDSQHGGTDFHYDGFANLAWSQSDDGSYRLRMPDAVGNLFSRDDRRDREYGAGGQLLTSSGPEGEAAFVYDARGNTSERRGSAGDSFRYAWDTAGMLRRVTRPDGSEISFAYDPFGRRVWKKCGGNTTRWLWDGAALLHEWVEHGQQLTWLREPHSDVPVAQLTPLGAQAIVTDHAGTPLALLDTAGRPLWAAAVDIYGALSMQVGDRQACPLRWSGMYEDAETGLFFDAVRARYYDPITGAYLSPSSGLAPPGLRAYAFERPPLVVAAAALQGRAAAAPALLGLAGGISVEHGAWTRLRDVLPAVRHGAAFGPLQPSAAEGRRGLYDALTAYAAAHDIELIRPPAIVLLATPARLLAPWLITRE